jgi:hypothetical protein
MTTPRRNTGTYTVDDSQSGILTVYFNYAPSLNLEPETVTFSILSDNQFILQPTTPLLFCWETGSIASCSYGSTFTRNP